MWLDFFVLLAQLLFQKIRDPINIWRPFTSSNKVLTQAWNTCMFNCLQNLLNVLLTHLSGDKSLSWENELHYLKTKVVCCQADD